MAATETREDRATGRNGGPVPRDTVWEVRRAEVTLHVSRRTNGVIDQEGHSPPLTILREVTPTGDVVGFGEQLERQIAAFVLQCREQP